MRPRALLIALCAGDIASSLAFVLPSFLKVPVLWYYPLQRRFALETLPSALAMDWYGRSLLALVAGLLIGALAYAVCRRREGGEGKEGADRTPTLFVLWAATATVFAMASCAYQLALREPVPEPLPSWYVPK